MRGSLRRPRADSSKSSPVAHAIGERHLSGASQVGSGDCNTAHDILSTDADSGFLGQNTVIQASREAVAMRKITVSIYREGGERGETLPVGAGQRRTDDERER